MSSPSNNGNGNGDGVADALGRITRLGLIAAAAGLAALLIALAVDLGRPGDGLTRQVLASYLMGYLFWLGLPLGCASLLLLNHLAGGTWGLVIRRPLEAGTATLPLLTILFLPIALSLPRLYPWAGAEHEGPGAHDVAEAEAESPGAGAEPIEDESHDGGRHAEAGSDHEAGGDHEAHDATGVAGDRFNHKEIWFARPFFFGRCAGYFAVWNILALLLLLWSGRQDGADDSSPSRRLGLLGAPGLILLFLTGTFAMFDWVMSLDPDWYSTIFGAMMIVGMGLETFAFIIFGTTLLADRGALGTALGTPNQLRDLGNLLLAFVMLWAYVAYSQYLIIWSGNLAEEVPWYLERLEHGWQVVAAVLIVFHFFLPFLALLFRQNKMRTGRLRLIAGSIFLIHALDIYWLTAPSLGYPHPFPALPTLLDLAGFVGVGGLFLAGFAFTLRRRPLVARRDPAYLELLASGPAHSPTSH